MSVFIVLINVFVTRTLYGTIKYECQKQTAFDGEASIRQGRRQSSPVDLQKW